nr:Gag-Pol polyprotein [Tanacetum cinerariifolium]
MSTQQDIYAAGSENRPPMLNKENYVPWSLRLLRYAKSRPNGKLIYNSFINGPYVRRMIPEPGDQNRKVEADDQAIQTIVLGLPEDIYAAVVQNAVQNSSVQNGLIVVLRITNQNPNRNGNVVAALAEGNAIRNNVDFNEIKKANANCILMANLQQASTSGTKTDKALVYDSDRSVENDSNVNFEVSSEEQDGGTVDQHPTTVEETRVDNTVKTRMPQPRRNTKNDRVPSASKSSCNKNKKVKVEEHPRNLLLSKNKKHMSSEVTPSSYGFVWSNENRKHKWKAFKTWASKYDFWIDQFSLDLTYTPSTIATQQPTEGELDLLFEAMYDDYIGGQPSATSRTALDTQEPQVRHTSTATTITADTTPTPTNSSSQAINFPNTSQDVDELKTQQHVQHQPATIVDNVPNAMFNENTFTKDHPLEQVIGEPSRLVLTRNQLRSDSDMCMYALTISIMEPKNVKEAMTYPAWIKSMQEELLQFKRLDVWVLVLTPDNIKHLTLKWLFKNKHDEENTVIQNKTRLVVRG